MSHRGRVAELIGAGERYRANGQPAKAEPLLREAVEIAQTIGPRDRLGFAAALNALGLLYKDLAKYDDARAAYEHALSLIAPASADGSSRREIATLYHNLGGIEHARSNYAEGEIFARRGLALRRQLEDADESELAADMVALAAILDGQQKFDEAEQLYVDALRILEQDPATNAREIAVALNDLGALYTQRDASERAEELLTRAAELKRQTIGPDHPDVAVTLNNLALVHKRRGDVARAAALYEDALSIFEATLGNDHPRTLACRRNHDRCVAPPGG